MVRKTKTSSSACPSSKTDSSGTSAENDSEKKTFLILSKPVILMFNLLKIILFELFVVLKFVYNTSSRLLHKPTTENQEVVNLETVKGSEDKTEMDLLQRQKFHHKKAFEYISQALKIDETQNPGVYVPQLKACQQTTLYMEF
jgi:cell division protein YceG involved in septum cleavage